MLPGQGECGIVPGKLKCTANGTEQGFLFLEKVFCLLSTSSGFCCQEGLWGLPGGANVMQILVVFEFFSWSNAGVAPAANSAASSSNSVKLELLAVVVLTLPVN